MGERDPRVDPVKGDAVRDCFGIVCTVLWASPSVVVREQAQGGGSTVSIDFWRGWYRGATVLKHGDANG